MTSEERQADLAAHGDEDALSMFGLVNPLLRHPWIVVAVPLVLVALVSVVTVLGPPRFTASSAFVPQGGAEGQVGRLSMLADQFGLDLGTSAQPAVSPEFYAELLRSRDILEPVVTQPYRTPRILDGDTTLVVGDLVERLEARGETREERVLRAVEELQERLNVETDLAAGIVSVSVTGPGPELAAEVNRRILEELSAYNLEKRQSQAAAERRFVEERLEEAQDELLLAEQELEGFLERTRRFEDSPRLRFERDRLQRQVDMRQQLYASLNQSYQQARIAEVRNTPLITIVERPRAPVEPDPKRLPIRIALAFVVGLVAGMGAAYVVDYARGARLRESDEFQEFVLLRSRLLGPVRRVGGTSSDSHDPEERARLGEG